MKRFVLLLSIIVFALTSCEGPAGPMGPPGEKGDEMTFYKGEFTVESRQWVKYDSGKYADFYSCQVNMDIGDIAYEDGIVNVYLFQYDDNGHEVQVQLPYSIQYTDGDNTWLRSYFFDFDTETIVFYLDWEKGLTPPKCYFRVMVAP